MEYTDGSCHGDKHGHGALPAQVSGWEIKERRYEGALDEGGVQAVVSPKEESREGEGGSGMGDEVWGSRADQMLGKGETHSA